MKSRSFVLASSLFLSVLGLLGTPPPPARAQEGQEATTPRVLDTHQMEWTPFPGIMSRMHRYEKLLAEDPASKTPARWAVRLVYATPGWLEKPTVTERSFAEYYEWAYFLGGEQPFCSYDDPSDETCNLSYHKRGVFMERPRMSVHGAADTKAEAGLPISRTGAISLFWHEKDAPEPFFGRPAPAQYLAMDKKLFTQPREVDTLAMEWEPHPTRKGWHRKLLSDHPGLTTVELLHMPAGFVDRERIGRRTSVPHHEFWYVLSGEMPLWYYASKAEKEPRMSKLREDFFVHILPGSDLGASDRETSAVGCTFLRIARYDLK